MALLENAPYQDLTYRIIGIAMELHNQLGPGYSEEVYQRGLEELFERHRHFPSSAAARSLWGSMG
jgi:GxxExxY protein